MKTKNRHTKSNFIRMGCAAMCLFYVIGLFNALLLETMHEVSHILAPRTHHHSFASDHETIDYSSLEAMAGHSHEALEVLKDLLEANQPHEQESQDEISFKLDKHFAEETRVASKLNTLALENREWIYQSRPSFWFQSVTTPPPQYS